MDLFKLLGRGKPGSNKAMMEKLRAAKKANESKLEELKDQVRDLTERAREKKREHDGESSKHLKKIVAGEISRILDEMDGLRSRETIIGRNLRTVALAIAKLQELETASQQGVSEAITDELAIDLEAIFADMKDTDRAVRDLEKMTYQPAREEEADIDERMADLNLDTQPETVEPEIDEALPEETQRRLKELDLDT